MSVATANIILDTIKNNPEAVFCLAAGDSPRLAYSLVAEKVRNQNIDVSRCKFVSLDEWVGIPPENEGSCQYFLRTVVFGPMKISPNNIHVFNALSSDLPDECSKMDDYIRANGGIDLMVVGVGRNGHIGFNEPGVPFEQYSHVVDLDETTQTVGQKYFRENTALTQGITLGLQWLMESQQAVLIANGEKKATVIKKALEEDIDPSMPASIIRRHPNATVILDEEAASLLNKKGV